MAKIQPQFEEFHKTIKLDAKDKTFLIEKKEIIKKAILDYFAKKNKDEKIDPPITVTFFDQGSYAMHTGVYPVSEYEDYDLDLGVSLSICKDDYEPMEVKQWIWDAVYRPPVRIPEHKKPCVRVQYTEDGLPFFHIDIATYADPSENSGDSYHLARGTKTCSKDDKKWEESSPTKVKNLINGWSNDEDKRAQFRRAIRDMKRWKDNNFDAGDGRPTGIGITALANNGFACCFEKERFTGIEKPVDAQALLDFTKYIINKFDPITGKISVILPVPPGNDLFAKFKDEHHTAFKKALERLRDALDFAINGTTDPHEACKRLEEEFGKDFPVPPKEQTARVGAPAIVGSNESA